MPFWELAIPAFPETAEGLTNFLWELGALGVVEEEQNGTPPRLRAFFPESASPPALTRAVSEYVANLGALGFPVAGLEPGVGPLLDEPWAEAWRRSFPPRPVGRRLLVAPSWEIPAWSDGRLLLIIEPGRAFGTGNHESTQGCLQLLESLLEGGPLTHAVDIGTGTGILAIAALLLGVPEATVLDTDPDALREAQANAGRNGVDRRLRCLAEGPESLRGAFPLLLANLLASSHVTLAPTYRRLLAPGGALILGGLLAEEEPCVRVALAACGIVPRVRVELAGWVSLLLTTADTAR